MKKQRTILFATITIIFSHQVIAKTKLTLQQAYQKKYISAKALCSGGLQLNYSVTNLIKDSLLLVVPAGWRFNSNAGKDDYQDILITHEEIFVLNPHQTKLFNVKGFCCEATKAGPQKGVPYTLGKMADSSLVKLARYLNTTPVDENTQQYSVWAISDGKPTANITANNDSIANLVRSFVSSVKGEPLPWYTLLKRANVSQTGFINDAPILFKATINYTIAKTCYSYCYIVDGKGNKVSESIGSWLYPENNEYKANLSVAGLKKGDYKLVLKNQQEALFEKEFVI